MRTALVIVSLIALILPSSLWAAEAPATAAMQADYQIAEPREQQMAGYSFCYVSKRTNLGTIKEAVAELMPKLEKAMDDPSMRSTGGVVFIYLGTMDEFELQVGSVVQEGAKAPAGFTLRKVEPFRCVTTLYSGPLATVGTAYQQLMSEAFKDRQPTGEWRESYLYWEGDNSPNNVVHIQIGAK